MPAEPLVVVIGANGLVGARVCAALVERGAAVRALVRRPGTAPALPGVEEVVGEFTDPDVAAAVVDGADAVVTTVHPMGSDRETQERIGVAGNAGVARAAAAAGVDRLVHVSTTAVYDRRPHVGDIDESADLVPDDDADYAVTKRDTDLALVGIDGLTRILVRPPAILGLSESSIWNAKRPAAMRADPTERRATPEQSWPWVHVDDLAVFVADVATGRITDADDPAAGPVAGAVTPVNVATDTAAMRDYVETVTGALGVEPEWVDEPTWTARIISDRARAWGWAPTVESDTALAEIAAGLTSR